ncbi:Uncharacterized protein dnm_002970 [Desulfonema magnum]|uniref:Uncharacterized protein n=1 Tax=Desulfonema magnum TaxID=45655 RepID=A0A975BFF4_9BACT|nr:Uncharacterized protein dnm_002970 [Desulfonema magnum]
MMFQREYCGIKKHEKNVQNTTSELLFRCCINNNLLISNYKYIKIRHAEYTKPKFYEKYFINVGWVERSGTHPTFFVSAIVP